MRTLVVAGLAAVLSSAAAASPTVPVHYTLAPVLDGTAVVALRVTARFAGDRSGVTRFDWPASWAGEDRLAQWTRDLTVDGAQSVEPAPHGGRIIHAAPGAALTVSYRVVSAYAADPSAADSRQASPVVRPGWFYAVGEALFATPAGRGDVPVRFHWHGAPGIGFASDLEHDRARPGHVTKTVDDLSESIVIGGRDLRVVRTVAGGAPLRVATIGRYGFETAAFETLVARVVVAERGFWRDRDAQPFLVTMIALAPDANRLSYSGTGRSDAFALWMDPQVELPGLAWLLAHEYFHTWNARQLGAMGNEEEEKVRYWLSEGFTDFYARRLMLHAGLLTPDQFAQSWNDMLAAYARSPFRLKSNRDVAAVFWTDQLAEKIPYQRGAMLAALWDARLRARGDSLDAVMRDQRRRVAGMHTSGPITELFVQAAARHGLDVRPDVARYVERGEAIELPRDVWGRCAAVATITRPVFVRGWDAEATAKAGNVVTGLDAASPAHAAGLRDGMTIVRRVAGVPGDSGRDYVLTVSDAGRERRIAFRPAGRETETLQQIVLDRAAFAAAPAACAAALAG